MFLLCELAWRNQVVGERWVSFFVWEIEASFFVWEIEAWENEVCSKMALTP